MFDLGTRILLAAAVSSLSFLSPAEARVPGGTTEVDLGTHSPGARLMTAIAAHNVSCKGRHDFELVVRDAAWLTPAGSSDLRGIRKGKRKSTNVVIDTVGLPPGTHRGRIDVRCLTCPAKCHQDRASLDVIVKIRDPEMGRVPSAQPAESRFVSDELMGALESWSDPEASMESIALDERPELIERYVLELPRVYGGLTVLEHFESNYPEATAELLEALGEEEISDAEAVAYVMSARDQDYFTWQKEPQLANAGLTFTEFVEREFPDAASDVARRSESPAKRGVRLIDHIRRLDDGVLLDQVAVLLDSIETFDEPCVCWTVVAFPHQPDPWQQEISEDFSSSSGRLPKRVQELKHSVLARGGAKDVNFHRRSRHNLWEVSRSKNTNYAHLRVRMLCTQSGEPGGVACVGEPCRGELAVRVAYGTRVHQEVAYGGPWSKEARAVAADWASLHYDPPGPQPRNTLFSKGVAVSGFTAKGWNSEAIIQLLVTAAKVGLVIATDGATAADLLDKDLVTETAQALFGLIKREGDPGSHHQDMFVAWDTAGSAPIQLLPNETHLFELETASNVYGRGYGGDSESSGKVKSSAYLAVVGRNYRCSLDATPPTPRAHWLWATSGTPQSAASLQNLVRNFIAVEIGQQPTDVSQQLGQYP